MGMAKKKRGRSRSAGQKGKRARRGALEAANDRALRRNMGIHPTDVMPHIVGRREWRGMRDYAPQENGPVMVRKVAP